jgi:hypothetical protein
MVFRALSGQIRAQHLEDLTQTGPALRPRSVVDQVLRHQVVQRLVFAVVSAAPQLFDELYR